MASANPSMMAVPTKALEIPPPGMPSGVGRWVKEIHRPRPDASVGHVADEEAQRGEGDQKATMHTVRMTRPAVWRRRSDWAAVAWMTWRRTTAWVSSARLVTARALIARPARSRALRRAQTAAQQHLTAGVDHQAHNEADHA